MHSDMFDSPQATIGSSTIRYQTSMSLQNHNELEWVKVDVSEIEWVIHTCTSFLLYLTVDTVTQSVKCF